MGTRGYFLALEGVDGAGKSTQVERLAAALGEAGRAVLRVREPGGTALGEEVRRILLDREEIHLTVETELLLFLASRVQLYEERVRPALDGGEVVIADRYHLSTLVYQGIAGGLGEARATDLCVRVLEGRLPNLNIIIDVPLSSCLQRVGGVGDRFEGRPGFLERVHQGFAAVRGLPGDRIEHVVGVGSPAEVAARILERVENAL